MLFKLINLCINIFCSTENLYRVQKEKIILMTFPLHSTHYFLEIRIRNTVSWTRISVSSRDTNKLLFFLLNLGLILRQVADKFSSETTRKGKIKSNNRMEISAKSRPYSDCSSIIDQSHHRCIAQHLRCGENKTRVYISS